MHFEICLHPPGIFIYNAEIFFPAKFWTFKFQFYRLKNYFDSDSEEAPDDELNNEDNIRKPNASESNYFEKDVNISRGNVDKIDDNFSDIDENETQIKALLDHARFLEKRNSITEAEIFYEKALFLVFNSFFLSNNKVIFMIISVNCILLI